MRRLPALLAALLLPATPQLLLGTAAFTGALLVSQAPAQVQSAEAVAKVAQAITVRIEGATQGSGVLVKRDGNRYTVLTAWHVVSGQRPGEELHVVTSDGMKHNAKILARGQILDLAELTFDSMNSYSIASIGEQSGDPSLKSMVTVAGYPLQRDFIAAKGSMYGFATNPSSRKGGYTLQYWISTREGMSGGPVLLPDGSLVGIHGESDISHEDSQRRNALGIPIAFYVIAKAEGGGLASDKKALLNETNTMSAFDYSVAGYRSQSEGQYQTAITQFSGAINLEPNWGKHWGDRGIAKAMSGDFKSAIQDISKAIQLVISGKQDTIKNGQSENSLLSALYFVRAKCWGSLKNNMNAVSDLMEACKHAISQEDRARSCAN
jgi:tetratricopeptide (TPR) repeat protein